MNNSGPSITCFPEDTVARSIFYESVFKAVDASSETTLRDGYRKSGAYGRWCSSILAANGTAGYANTVATAQDMLRYIELRAKELGRSPREAQLWFYGVSYGTLLGATYATLFPNRIGRMILDGVVEAEDYYTSGSFTSSVDADAAVRTFFTACFEAGPEVCVFHKNATSPDELEARYMAIYDSLKEEPIEVTDPSLGIPPFTVRWQDVSTAVFIATYTPTGALGFTALAQVLTELEQRNGNTLAFILGQMLLASRQGYDSREARSQISCADLNGRFNTSTYEEYVEYVSYQNNQSFYAGPTVSVIFTSVCRELHVFPPESQVFDGASKPTIRFFDHGRTDFAIGKAGANKTSVPILFIGNTLDPITPLRSAKKMSSLFAGSRVLTLDIVHVSDPSHAVLMASGRIKLILRR